MTDPHFRVAATVLLVAAIALGLASLTGVAVFGWQAWSLNQDRTGKAQPANAREPADVVEAGVALGRGTLRLLSMAAEGVATLLAAVCAAGALFSAALLLAALGLRASRRWARWLATLLLSPWVFASPVWIYAGERTALLSLPLLFFPLTIYLLWAIWRPRVAAPSPSTAPRRGI